MATSAQEEFDELMRDKGRRNRHPEDDDELRPITTREMSAASSLSLPMPRSSMSSVRDRIPNLRYVANTGPKGVIADAQDFRQQKRVHRLISRNSKASLTSERQAEPPGRTFGQQQRTEKAVQALEVGNGSEGEQDDDDDDGDDDDFVAQWRNGRMQELRLGSRKNSGLGSRQLERHYGGVSVVDAQGYLDAVEGSGPATVVAVYIYDDVSQVSQLFENCLRTLSHKHESVRFVKLHFADAEMEPAGVPALIAYRGGEKFAALVPIIEEMPADGDLDALTLEKVLQRHQILT